MPPVRDELGEICRVGELVEVATEDGRWLLSLGDGDRLERLGADGACIWVCL